MGDPQPLRFGDTPVGPGEPPVLLAEIGTLFNQDLDEARAMVRAVREAREVETGTPILLKGEVLHTADICLDDDAVETYHSSAGASRSERYRELIERKVVSLDQYRAVFGMCPDLPFVLSVYDAEGADFAVSVGAVGLKIASSNITHVPLIRHVARLGVPVILDTGRSTLAEVGRAVDTARGAGCGQLLLEHSPDGHPALPENHNLRLLQTLARAFDAPVGLSDHHDGEEMLALGVALGACLVEKGVTFDPDALEQDASHAMALERLVPAARAIHTAWLALGRGTRDLDRPIAKLGTSARMGLVARHDLAPGDPIDEDHVTFAFPARGIPVEHWDEVTGWVVTEAIAAGAAIGWGQLSQG